MNKHEIHNLSMGTKVAIFLAIVISTELGSNLGLYLATLAWLGLPYTVRLEEKAVLLWRRHKPW